MRRAIPFAILLRGAVAAGCLVPAQLLAQQEAPPSARLQALMSERDLRETGVGRLTRAERAALERWLSRYTATVATTASTLAPRAEGARRPPAPSPRRAQPAPAEPARERLPEVVRPSRAGRPQVAVGALVEITSVLGGGGFLVMADGTMWEVWAADQPKTATWAAGDRVLVREQPAPPAELYTLRFENGRARTEATVRYAGVARPAAVSIGRAEETTRLGPDAAGQVPYYYGYGQSYPVYVPVPAYRGYYDPWYGRGRRDGGRPDGWRPDRGEPRGRLDALPGSGSRNVGVRPPAAPQMAPPPRMAAPPTMAPAPKP